MGPSGLPGGYSPLKMSTPNKISSISDSEIILVEKGWGMLIFVEICLYSFEALRIPLMFYWILKIVYKKILPGCYNS